MSNPPQKVICSSRNKSQMAPNEKVCFHEKLGSRLKSPRKSLLVDRKRQFFQENMKERGSRYGHVALCGSA